MAKKNHTAYELAVKGLLSTRIVEYLPDSNIEHNCHVRGKSGHIHQIDILARISLADVSIVIAVECKEYSGRVKIDDVLEFASRLEDIAAHKGILVSTIGFTKGAKRVATAKGIGLVKAHGDVWLSLHCSTAGFGGKYYRERRKRIRRRPPTFEKLVANFIGDYFEQDLAGNWRAVQEFLSLVEPFGYSDGKRYLGSEAGWFDELGPNGPSHVFTAYSSLVFDLMQGEKTLPLTPEGVFVFPVLNHPAVAEHLSAILKAKWREWERKLAAERLEREERKRSFCRAGRNVAYVALNSWTKCPWCGWRFSIRDPNAWSGSTHLICGTKLRLVKTDYEGLSDIAKAHPEQAHPADRQHIRG